MTVFSKPSEARICSEFDFVLSQTRPFRSEIEDPRVILLGFSARVSSPFLEPVAEILTRQTADLHRFPILSA